jgi:polysaccharide biosynthesis transport protein
VVEEPAAGPKVPVPVPPPPPQAPVQTAAVAPPVKHFNPVLQGQIESVEAEIAKHQQELQRLSKLVANYQAKLEAIPVREEETMDLSRDYDMTKQHYSQLEAQALSAETATQLEYRQQGEKFVVLDPAITPEKPSKPNRPMLDAGGALLGLILGLTVALSPEFFGMTIIGPKDITSAGSLVLLETIPVIMTSSDQIAQRRRTLLVAASACLTTIIAAALLFLRFRHQI